MLKGALFDLDGVLVETEHFQWQGWVEVLKPYNISLSKEEYYKYAGKRGDITDAELIKDFDLNIEKGSLIKPKEKILIKWFAEKPLKLMPYAWEALEFFVKNNLKVGLASGGPKDEVMLKLERLNLLQFFEIIVSGTDIEKGKPDPETYLVALEKLGLNPEDCVVFEDTQYGLESAKSAGAICCAIPNEFSQQQDFSKADVVSPSLEGSIGWIRSRYNL